VFHEDRNFLSKGSRSTLLYGLKGLVRRLVVNSSHMAYEFRLSRVREIRSFHRVFIIQSYGICHLVAGLAFPRRFEEAQCLNLQELKVP